MDKYSPSYSLYSNHTESYLNDDINNNNFNNKNIENKLYQLEKDKNFVIQDSNNFYNQKNYEISNYSQKNNIYNNNNNNNYIGFLKK